MKLEANELRIGNLVDFNGQIETVYQIRNSGVTFYRGKTKKSVVMQSYVWDAIKPIPLLEEWLLKFGFEKDLDGFYRKKANYLIEVLFHDNGIIVTNQSVSLKHIEHIHQLQNLYFALTGEELIIKN